jgi:hypothetical protein
MSNTDDFTYTLRQRFGYSACQCRNCRLDSNDKKQIRRTARKLLKARLKKEQTDNDNR